jgi:hypothetical protein
MPGPLRLVTKPLALTIVMPTEAESTEAEAVPVVAADEAGGPADHPSGTAAELAADGTAGHKTQGAPGEGKASGRWRRRGC